MPERKVHYDVVSKGQLNGIRLMAPSLQRLYIDSGLALTDYRVSLDLVKEVSQEKVQVTATSLPQLLNRWLGSLIKLYSQKKFLPYRIVFTHFDAGKIEAALSGEVYEATRHGYARNFSAIAETPDLGEAPEGGFRTVFFLK